jgi:hypothetical protein
MFESVESFAGREVYRIILEENWAFCWQTMCDKNLVVMFQTELNKIKIC